MISFGDPPFSEKARDEAVKELRDAGVPRDAIIVTSREREVLKFGSQAEQMSRIGICIPQAMVNAPREWVTLYTVKAEAFGWEFRRAWCYWACSTMSSPRALPLAVADKLYESHGRVVRVHGNCTAPAPTAPVFSYHVDTQDGLAALVNILREQQKGK